MGVIRSVKYTKTENEKGWCVWDRTFCVTGVITFRALMNKLIPPIFFLSSSDIKESQKYYSFCALIAHLIVSLEEINEIVDHPCI